MEGKPLIVVTWPISDLALSVLREKFTVKVHQDEEVLSPQRLKEFVTGADAILCLLTNKITAEVIESAGPQLKIIASMSVGYDHIDVSAAAAKNVVVTNTPGVLDNAVAEHAVALMMALAKSIPQADKFMRARRYTGWDPRLFLGPELSGKILGIVGLGRIGSVVSRICGYGLGMSIAYNDVNPNPNFETQFNAKYFSLDELLQVADIVTLHVPLLPTTQHLINAERLNLMKPTAYLINTSRGPVVDEAALAKALRYGRIAGAGLDVYEYEPEITSELLALPNVVLTPHTASATHEARLAMAEKAVANILAVLSGENAPDMIRPKS